MDEKAPITWLIAEISSIVSGGASTVAGGISTAIAPLASVGFGIYIILICINYLRGAETEPVIDFGMRCVGFAVIIGLGLNASNYSSIVIPIVTGLGSDLGNIAGGGSASAGSLDSLALHYLKIIEDGFTFASGQSGLDKVATYIQVALKSVVIIFGLAPFLVAATVALVVADTGSIMVAMVGPLFFAFLIFPATRQYFSAWVNTALSYALIPLFVAVIAMISVGLSTKMLSSGGSLDQTSFTSVLLASVGNLVLLFLIKQVGSLASSLSAGGINAAMPGSIGTLANAIRSGVAGSSREVKGISSAARSLQTWREARANRSNSIRKAG